MEEFALAMALVRGLVPFVRSVFCQVIMDGLGLRRTVRIGQSVVYFGRFVQAFMLLKGVKYFQGIKARGIGNFPGKVYS